MCVVYCHCIQFIILAHSLKIDVKPFTPRSSFKKYTWSLILSFLHIVDLAGAIHPLH